MSVIASITTSVDGFVTGPDDGPAAGLGIGGKRLFEGFDDDIDLEIRQVYTSPFATHVLYAIAR